VKILELGKFYAPERGGIETLLKLWAEGFAAAGDEVRCVVAGRSLRTVREWMAGVQVERLASFGMALSTSLCPTYPLAVRRIRADVIHGHTPNPLVDLASLLAPRRTPVVLSWHSDVIRQKTAMKFYAPLQRAMLRRADAVVVATPAHFEFSPWLQEFSAKIRVIPFGLDLRRFDASPRILAAAAVKRAQARLPRVLLNLGRLVGYKGQRYAIEALRDVPDTELWIGGTGPLDAELRTLAATCGVADRVRFLGDIEDDELPAWFHACDAFVFPSITPNEAFGLVLVEAMACGKPLIACQLKSGVPWVCRDGVNGLTVPPQDAKALAAALNRLLSDPVLSGHLGSGGRKLAHEEFSAPVMVSRYRELFSGLIARTGPR
jgi:glycosyltransferase involved in cell wall biosynthesis